MKLWQKIILVVIVVIGLFVLTAPASLITEAIPEDQSNISVSGFQGKAINGSASQIVINGVSVQNVGWDLNLLSSISGTPSAKVSVDDPAANITSDIAFVHNRNWSVADLNGQITPSEMAKFAPAIHLVNPSGAIDLNAVSVALDETAFTAGSGTLQWNNAGLRLYNQTYDLKTIRADLQLQGNDLLVRYSGDSDLAPAGNVILSAQGDYEMTLEIEPSALPNNMQWMANMGQKLPSGKLSFSLKGKLRL